jgi:peptide deformylase
MENYDGKALRIREVGDPILSIKCKKVDVKNLTNEDYVDIEDMKASLDFSGGFGIAAPQVGINKRIIIIKVDKEKCSYKDCEDVPTTVMINPTWKPISEEKYIEFEGCLSVPTIRGKVERYKEIEVTYYDESGIRVKKMVSGFTARDIQHECDHIDGIVFLDKGIPNGYATLDMIKQFELRKD